MIEFKRKCPYCGKLMEKGKIPPRNYPLKWKSEDGNRSGLNYLFNLDKIGDTLTITKTTNANKAHAAINAAISTPVIEPFLQSYSIN